MVIWLGIGASGKDGRGIADGGGTGGVWSADDNGWHQDTPRADKERLDDRDKRQILRPAWLQVASGFDMMDMKDSARIYMLNSLDSRMERISGTLLIIAQYIFLIMQDDLHYDDETIAAALNVKRTSVRSMRSRIKGRER